MSKHTVLINWVVVKVWKSCYVNCCPSLKVFWRTPQKACEMTMKPWYEIMAFYTLVILRIHWICTEQSIQICQVHFDLEGLLLPATHFCNPKCFPLLSALQLRCLATRSRQKTKLVIHMKVWDSIFDFVLIWNQKRQNFFNTFSKLEGILQLVMEIKTDSDNTCIK